jgi:hypothetical protein
MNHPAHGIIKTHAVIFKTEKITCLKLKKFSLCSCQVLSRETYMSTVKYIGLEWFLTKLDKKWI